jgi:hypothetical protein
MTRNLSTAAARRIEGSRTILTKLFSIAGVAGLVVWANSASAADRLSDRQLETVRAGATPITTSGATVELSPTGGGIFVFNTATGFNIKSTGTSGQALNNLRVAAVLAIRPGAH